MPELQRGRKEARKGKTMMINDGKVLIEASAEEVEAGGPPRRWVPVVDYYFEVVRKLTKAEKSGEDADGLYVLSDELWASFSEEEEAEANRRAKELNS